VSDISQSSRAARPNGNGAEDHRDDLTSDLALLRDDVAKLTDSVSHMLRGQAGVAGTQLRDMANEAYSTANEAADIFQRAGSGLYSDAKGRLDTLGTELTQTVVRAPLT